MNGTTDRHLMTSRREATNGRCARLRRFVLLVVAVVAIGTAAAAVVPECEERIDGIVRLSGDVSCGEAGGVTLSKGAIRLNGFAISSKGPAVRCEGNCTIVGPGVIDGGIHGAGMVRIKRVAVSGSDDVGVRSKKIVLHESRVHGFWNVSVVADSAVIRRSSVAGGEVLGLELADARMTRDAIGVAIGRGRIIESSISGHRVEGGCHRADECVDLIETAPRSR